jgi:catechol-2,3-dioxygenase
MLEIERLDHFVLTIKDIRSSLNFYNDVLGMKIITFGNNRKALQFGQQKINLHQHHQEFEPKATQPTPGSADICLITQQSLQDWVQHLQQHSIEILEGPVSRTGAIGAIESIYCRDPDGNLIAISVYG